MAATTALGDSVHTSGHEWDREHRISTHPLSDRRVSDPRAPDPSGRVDGTQRTGRDGIDRRTGDGFRVGRVQITGDDRMGPTWLREPGAAAPWTAPWFLSAQSNARGPYHPLIGGTGHTPNSRPKHSRPGDPRGRGRHRLRPGRGLGITWLTLAVAAVVLAAGAAIIQLRNTVTIEAIGRGAEADASNGQARIPPDGPVDGSTNPAPPAGGPTVPFQVRPVAVVQDITAGDRAGPVTEQPVESPQPPAVSPEVSAAAQTVSGPIPAEPPSGDLTTQPAEPSVEPTAEAKASAPTGSAPAVAAQIPSPPVVVAGTPPKHTPDPVGPSEPTTAPPPTTAAPTRGQSAAHRPDHANGGVGNTEHPAPADPEPKPDN